MANDLLGNGPALVTAVLPSGGTSVARVSLSAERYLCDSKLAATIDRVAWRTIAGSTRSKVLDSQTEPMVDHKPMLNAGVMQWVSVYLPSYLLPGYPAVLHAFRADSSIAMVPEQVRQLQDVTGATQPFAGPTRTRLFVFDGSAEPMVAEDDWNVLDSKLKLEILARMRQLLEQTTESAEPTCDRVAHVARSGQMVSVRYNAFADHPAAEGKPAVIVAVQPSVDEWLAIQPNDLPADREFGRFLPALKFISDQSSNSPTLLNIARSVHLSQFHFHRKFGELIGMTPKQYMLECQIAKAQSLLSEGVLELSKVAELCGFSHQSHFTSRFKQTTGLTPSRWRKLVRQPGS